MNLAKVIFKSYPDSDLLPISEDVLSDIKSLYKHVLSASPAELGDGLFRFVVIEALEAGECTDGHISIHCVLSALRRAITDIESVVEGIELAAVDEVNVDVG